MTNLYSRALVKNIYKSANSNSEVISQIIYGEKLKVLKKKKNWLKIKTISDKYIGYIKNSKTDKNFNSTHKCHLLKTKIYNRKGNVNEYLAFNSRITIGKIKNGYGEFEKGKWIKLNQIKKKSFVEKNFLKIVNKFLGSKYLWGGKTYKGIDCSALIQLIYLFNNKFFPRDTKDQIKFSKKNFKKKISKKDI